MSLPRPNPYASTASPTSSLRRTPHTTPPGLRLPRLLKRLLKFPQMDFEVAVWEMSHLLTSPKRVFRNAAYRQHVRHSYAAGDPAFLYLLAAFVGVTGLAWALAYARGSVGVVARVVGVFVGVQFAGVCGGVAGGAWVVVPRVCGRGGWAEGRGGRRRGLFGGEGEEGVELGFCFEVAIRAFFPVWVYLYVLQFLLLPVVTAHHWTATLLSNTLHLAAYAHGAYITFLGYNSLPSLSGTHFLVSAPVAVYVVLWLIACLTGFNASIHFAPILWCGGGLRKPVG